MSFLNKLNELVFGYDDDEELEESDFTTNDAPRTTAASEPDFSVLNSRKAKVVNINTTAQLKVVVVQLESFNEVKEIADHLKNKKPVVINLEKLERDTARRVVDFISGAVYALDGDIQKVSGGIFLLAPYNVSIMGNFQDELRQTGIFPWE